MQAATAPDVSRDKLKSKIKAESSASCISMTQPFFERDCFNMKFNGDILITDPMYIIRKGDDGENDWYDCEFGDKLSNLGIKNFLTVSGDLVGAKVVSNDTNEVLGEFCSDSAAVSVMLLSEVLAYNPKYSDELKKYPNTGTIIKDFNGDIKAIRSEDSISFVGKGNINFHTED